EARELEEKRSHDLVREPETARVAHVRPDAADLGGEMEDARRLRVAEEPFAVLPAREVVVAPPRDEDIVPFPLEPLDEVRAEEPAAARDEDPHAGERSAVSQSTRPIQRSRFVAYHAIVCATPSSQDTVGFQPVSRFSFS